MNPSGTPLAIYFAAAAGTLLVPVVQSVAECAVVAKPAPMRVGKWYVVGAVSWDALWAAIAGLIVWTGQRVARFNVSATYLSLRHDSSPRQYVLIAVVGLLGVTTGVGARKLGNRVGGVKPRAQRDYPMGRRLVIAARTSPKIAALESLGSCRDEWCAQRANKAVPALRTLGVAHVKVQTITFLHVRALSSPLGRNSRTVTDQQVEPWINKICDDPLSSDEDKCRAMALALLENDGLRTLTRLDPA